MYELTVRQKFAAVILLILLAIGGALLYLRQEDRSKKIYYLNQTTKTVETVYVHLCGAVKRPGVLKLPVGLRKFQILQRAGGALPEADLNQINLAEVALDGEQIYLPKQGEEIPQYIKKQQKTKTGKTGKSKSEASKKTPPPRINWPIDLNAATQAQLEAVPGIGPSLALRILAYRSQNGNFSNYEELNKVSGIGPSKLEKFRPYLSVK